MSNSNIVAWWGPSFHIMNFLCLVLFWHVIVRFICILRFFNMIFRFSISEDYRVMKRLYIESRTWKWFISIWGRDVCDNADGFSFCIWKGGGPYGQEVTRGQDLTGKDFSGLTLIKQDFKTVRSWYFSALPWIVCKFLSHGSNTSMTKRLMFFLGFLSRPYGDFLCSTFI